MKRTQKWPVAYGQRALRAPAASRKPGSDGRGGAKHCPVLQEPWLLHVCHQYLMLSPSLAYCNKHLLSERQRSMKILLARQGSGWVVGGFA